jgi:transcriptional regulator with XRE-family HTH domain
MEFLTFAQNVKYLRELDGLKQVEMHTALGFKRTTWNGYETGKSLPGLHDLTTIADYFGIQESDLLRTDIPKSDLIEVYNRYINGQEQPQNIGNTPRSKTFLAYLNGISQAIPPTQNGTFVHESVQNPVQNTPKKGVNAYQYDQQKQSKSSLQLNEPGTTYNAGKKLTDTQRIAQLERLLLEMKALFSRYLS